jgi:hypothetical protein
MVVMGNTGRNRIIQKNAQMNFYDTAKDHLNQYGVDQHKRVTSTGTFVVDTSNEETAALMQLHKQAKANLNQHRATSATQRKPPMGARVNTNLN